MKREHARTPWLVVVLLAGCSAEGGLPDVVRPVPPPIDGGTFPMMEAGASEGGSERGPSPTCALFAASVPGWGAVDCGLDTCQILVALEPGSQSTNVTWVPEASGLLVARPPPGNGMPRWRGVVGGYTVHGPMLWIGTEVDTSVSSMSFEQTWALSGLQGPPVGVVKLISSSRSCYVSASGVSDENSALEVTDALNRRAVFFRGPDASDPAWQSVYAQAWTGDIVSGGALASTRGALYVGVERAKIYRVEPDASGSTLETSLWIPAGDFGGLGSTSDVLFYQQAERAGYRSIQAIPDGEPGRTLGPGWGSGSGPPSAFALAASATTLAWVDQGDANGRRVWHSPITTQEDGLLPSSTDVIDGLPSVTNGETAAVGFGYYVDCFDQCTLVRLRDGVRFNLQSVNDVMASEGGKPRPLWVGPDEFAVAIDRFAQTGRTVAAIVRVPYAALSAL